MIATAWRSAKQGSLNAVYGLRVSIADRDLHFDRRWTSIELRLLGLPEPVVVNISESFWRRCTEMRSKDIGRWMRDRKLASWPNGHPPKFSLESLGGKTFTVRPLDREL